MSLALSCGLLLLAGIVLYDLLQTRHALLRNFPLIGHFRYWLESIGPELRQYIVTSNDEERPFSRDQRRWVYASAKKENEYFGFGTDNNMDTSQGYLIIRHAAMPYRGADMHQLGQRLYPIPCAKILGGARNRKHAFRPASLVNVSAMSFGSLSGRAVEAINRGCALASALHNTGEGGISNHHLHGGDLIYQIGTGYFGCRDERGHFHLARLKETLAAAPVRAIEIKLSQGAKPGLGGVLPGGKVTAEIAAARGVVPGTTCISPAHHSAFSSVDEMLDFIEMLAAESGLPVGIKSAVGQMNFWNELAELMAARERGPDSITIDGGEGGTGAAPLSFSDHVALPIKAAFPAVFRLFAERGLADSVVFIASGKLGFPETSLFAFAMGADMVHLAREAMLAIGCIQAQRCHTNHCPTGVATQNTWLARGLDPTLKACRLANYLATLRKELLRLSWAVGVAHPALVGLDHFGILNGAFDVRDPRQLLAYDPSWGLPGARGQAEILALAAETYGSAV